MDDHIYIYIRISALRGLVFWRAAVFIFCFIGSICCNSTIPSIRKSWVHEPEDNKFHCALRLAKRSNVDTGSNQFRYLAAFLSSRSVDNTGAPYVVECRICFEQCFLVPKLPNCQVNVLPLSLFAGYLSILFSRLISSCMCERSPHRHLRYIIEPVFCCMRTSNDLRLPTDVGIAIAYAT